MADEYSAIFKTVNVEILELIIRERKLGKLGESRAKQEQKIRAGKVPVEEIASVRDKYREEKRKDKEYNEKAIADQLAKFKTGDRIFWVSESEKGFRYSFGIVQGVTKEHVLVTSVAKREVSRRGTRHLVCVVCPEWDVPFGPVQKLESWQPNLCAEGQTREDSYVDDQLRF